MNLQIKKLQLICQGNKKLLNKINYSINGYKKSKDLRPFFVEHPNATIISFGFNIFDKVFFAVKGLQNRLIYAETNASDKYVSERYYNNIKYSKCYNFFINFTYIFPFYQLNKSNKSIN